MGFAFYRIDEISGRIWYEKEKDFLDCVERVIKKAIYRSLCKTMDKLSLIFLGENTERIDKFVADNVEFAKNLTTNISSVNSANQDTTEKIATYYFKQIYKIFNFKIFFIFK